MFSGIIEELGLVDSIQRQGNIFVCTVEAQKVLKDTKIGDSIAVNGVCLTVIKIDTHSLVFELMPETAQKSNLGALRRADRVNLERSLKVGERISGHFVTGHVECTGVIRRKYHRDGNVCFEIAIPPHWMRQVIPKGSIAIDGISLTVVNTRSNTLSVYLIPHTLAHTTLGSKGPSHKVNIEFDILTKQRLAVS